MEGENIRVECKFNFNGNPIIFCKENCEGENILINTTEGSTKKGRYSTSYETHYTSAFLHVRISEVKRSDSGRYRCGFGKDRSQDYEFYLDVTEATTSEPNWTLKTFPLTMNKGLQLYLILSLVAKIILLSTPLMISCWKKRTTKSKDSAGETGNAAVSQINPEREENPEDRQNN
ncbi:uncharacterized protein LOC111608107 isoform X2 [Xiphophorus maculatus]|nr:uncharacterized protein LOC111608107 isoform X2 [Xiphophorus maculatus]